MKLYSANSSVWQLLTGVSRASTMHRLGRAPPHSRSQASLQHAEPNHRSIDQQFGLVPAREHLLTWLPALFEIYSHRSSLALDLHFAVNSFPDFSSDPGEQIICFAFVMASSTWTLGTSPVIFKLNRNSFNLPPWIMFCSPLIILTALFSNFYSLPNQWPYLRSACDQYIFSSTADNPQHAI